jgi:hypothetical protein
MDKSQEKNQQQGQPTLNEETLLKAALDVVNRALVEVDKLEKGSVYEEDEEFKAEPVQDGKQQMEKEAPPEEQPIAEEKPAEEPAPEQKPEEEQEPEQQEEEKGEDEEESEEVLKGKYESYKSKMEKRGLLKSETAEVPATEKKEVEELRKSFSDEFETLRKTISAIAEKVEQIASTPMPRKGASGVQPLLKTEQQPEAEGEGQPMTKSEAIDKLLELKKSGDARITTTLISKFESGRGLTAADQKTLKSVLN